MSKAIAQFFVSTETNALATHMADNALNGGIVTINNKTGKQAGLAGLVAFGSSEVRRTHAEGIVLRQLASGQYRPVVAEILNAGLIPKAALPWVEANLPTTGPLNKANLVNVAKQVYSACVGKTNKAGEPVVYKNQKLFAFQLCQAIVQSEMPEELVAGSVVAEA
jgi:hypothetical protein